MPYSPCYNVLFIHIPKTGGTSVEQALGVFADWQLENQVTLFGMIQDPDLKSRGWGSAFLQHLTFAEIQQVWSYPDAHILASVRNPWARFASVYRNLDTHLQQTAVAMGIQLDGLSFPDFVAATEDLNHAHLRPQTDYLPSPAHQDLPLHLLRTESLQQDFQRVCQQLGLTLSLPWSNRSPRHESWHEVYCLKTWARIGERYQQDVLRLGYEQCTLSTSVVTG